MLGVYIGTAHLPCRIGLDYFSEKSLDRQSSRELKKGIRKLERRISEHQHKIENPEQYWKEWHSFDEKRKQNELNHWKSEIRKFKIGITYRTDKLKELEDE